MSQSPFEMGVQKNENKVAVAIAVRAAMREHRRDKSISFEWPKRWSYLGDGEQR